MRRLFATACLAGLTGGLLVGLSRSRDRQAQIRRQRDALATDRRALLHDMRGSLSPILMAADRLSTHADPKVAQLAELMIKRVEQATERLRK